MRYSQNYIIIFRKKGFLLGTTGLVFLLVFFAIRNYFHIHWQFIRQQRKRGYHLLFHSTIFIRSRTFRHLSAALHMRWGWSTISYPKFRWCILWKMMTSRKSIRNHMKADAVLDYFDIFWWSGMTYEFLSKSILDFLPKNMNYFIITSFPAKTIEIAPFCSINVPFGGRNTIVWWIRVSLMTLMRAPYTNESKTCALN